jgi:hypothetical protein
MHKTKPDQFKSVNDWWQWFIDMLQQRDLFKDFQLPSIKTLREYIKITKAKVAAENRWTDANGTVRSNLSDHAGDLSPLAKVVQNILLDEEEAEATRDLNNKNKELAQELDRTEENVLTDCANGSAKRRRLGTASASAGASAAGGGGASASYTTPRGGSLSASSLLDQTIIDLLSGDNKKKDEADDTEAVILVHLVSSGWERVAVDAGGLNDDDARSALEDIGYEIVANVFSHDGEGASADYFSKKELVEYGLNKLQAHKLYLYLKAKAQVLREQEQGRVFAQLMGAVETPSPPAGGATPAGDAFDMPALVVKNKNNAAAAALAHIINGNEEENDV